MTRVALLDYGSGNLHSAGRALVAAGADVVQSASREALWDADALVVPGVGAFAACMAGLKAVSGDALIFDWIGSGRPLLGICVGHQILFETGTEHGLTTEGLGILPGAITELDARPLPHMGWNQVAADSDSRLFDGLAGSASTSCIPTQRAPLVGRARPSPAMGEQTSSRRWNRGRSPRLSSIRRSRGRRGRACSGIG